ncbi:hypothetical protein GCM10023314_19200 [Algibacter agarivorans]|uniref:Lipocalin-like domain-containing protein n=1 Tax=Algibacter agarivorans TaxID=1109741 RepID=A0ABP9GJZ1_9FLAO
MPEEMPLVPTSVAANLVQRTTLKDGSIDNIIDKASCITIKLPVSLVVNSLQITVNNEDDFDTIEAIFDDSDTDTDTLVITFPITIILENFTESLVVSESELNSYRNNCPDENEDDDDIECIDFNYPITVTTYNTLIDELGSETIYTDKEFYEFIDDIEDYLIVNINFPIELTGSDGTFLSIGNLDDLEDAIEDAIDDCDEDDDYDSDEDDNISASEQEFKDLLMLCKWEVKEFEVDEQHIENQFNGYRFTFNADGTAIATDASNTDFNGSWTVSTNSGLRLSIQFADFSVISAIWRLHEINPEDDGTRLDLRNLEDHIKLRQDCP